MATHRWTKGTWTISTLFKQLPQRVVTALSSQWPSSWKHAIPNILTLMRLVIAPVIFLCLWSKAPALAWIVLGLYSLAAITDYLDGMLSRLWQTESWLGRVLDPIADKLLVASVLVGLIAFRPASFWVTLVVYILLMRELLVSGLREASSGSATLAVSIMGKAKTLLQMVALFVLLAENAVGLSFNVGYYILAASMVLSVLSLGEYAIRIVQAEREKKANENADEAETDGASEAGQEKLEGDSGHP